TGSEDPAERTRLNVVNTDATVLLTTGEPTGGSRLTAQIAFEYQKPILHLDLSRWESKELAELMHEWLEKFLPRVLNIAGGRQTEDPQIFDPAYKLFATVLKHPRRSLHRAGKSNS